MPLANCDKFYPLYHDGFGEDSYEFFRRFFNTATDFSFTFQDGLPISMGFLVEKSACISGTVVKVGYLSGLCTKSEYRGKGLISKIIRELLQKAFERRYPLVFLSPFNDKFYLKYGFKDLLRYNLSEYKVKDSPNISIDKTFQPALKTLVALYEKASADYDNKILFGINEARLKTEEYFCDNIPVSIIYDSGTPKAFFFETDGSMDFYTGDVSLLEAVNENGLKREVINNSGERSYLQCRACFLPALNNLLSIENLSLPFQIKEAEIKQNNNIILNGEYSSYSFLDTDFFTNKVIEKLTAGKSFFMDKY